MKIVCISDIHGNLVPVPECDMLLIAGDITPATNHHVSYQFKWLDSKLRIWLRNQPAKHIVGIAGNHDFIFEQHASLVQSLNLPWTYLENNDVVVDGIKIWGSPFSNWFFDWAFNAPKSSSEPYLANLYEKIAPDTDIIITHGPPWGKHPEHLHNADIAPPYRRVNGKMTSENHVGSHALLERMKVIYPKMVLTGHLHVGSGVYNVPLGNNKECLVANASLLDDSYNVVHNPLVFEWDQEKRMIHAE